MTRDRMSSTSSRATRLAFGAVVLLALALRLWRLDLTTFGSDEAVLLHFAEDMVRNGSIPLSGPLSSVGLSTPAHFIYLIAPVVAISRDPVLTAGALALLGTAAVVITIVLGWRAFGPRAGLLAGLLFATNPTAVEYSRRIWQPGPLLFLSALVLLALDLGVIGRRKRWAAATFPTATLATLMHTSFLPMLPLLAAPFAVLALARRWRHLLAGIVVAAALTVPFVAHEVQTEWKDYPNFRYYSSLRTFVDLDALRWTVAISTGWLLPNDGVVPPPQRVLPQPVIDATADLALALLAFALLTATITLVRRGATVYSPTRFRLLALILVVVLPVVSAIRHWQPLFLHYYFVSLPAVFLLLGFAASRGRFARLLAIPAVGLVAGIQAIAIVGGYTYQGEPTRMDPCFLTPIVAARSVAFDVAEFAHSGGSTGAVVELDTGQSKPMAYLLRADFADVFLPHPNTPSQTPTLVGNVGLGRPMPTMRLRRDSERASTLPERLQLDLRYDTGVQLHDVAFAPRSRFDQHADVAFNWSVDATSAWAGPLVWRIALLDANGTMLQTDTGDRLLPSMLRAQRLVSWFGVDLRRTVAPDVRTPGAYQIEVDLLDASTDRAVEQIARDAAGTPREAIRLPIEIGAFQHCDLPSTIP